MILALSQTYKNFKIILVNDGSADNSVDVVEQSYPEQISTGLIKIINQVNQGVSIARNEGIKASNTEYICFLDADDEWKPDFLKQMKLLIQDYPLAILYCLQHETKVENKPATRNSSYYKNNYRGYVNNFSEHHFLVG